MGEKKFAKPRNIYLLYTITCLQGMMFFLPILALYFQQTLFTAQNVAIIFAVEAIAAAIFEVPTGAVADLFGRKRTMILASGINILSIATLFIGGSMWMFVIYAVISALANALNSGTDTALMYDTLKEIKKEKYYKKISGIHMALWPVGAAVGSIVGGYLATISLQTPVLYSLIPYTLVLLLNFLLVEPQYERQTDSTFNGHIIESIKDVLHNKQLIFILLGGIVAWSFGESMQLMSQLFFQYKNIPIIWFGYAEAAGFTMSSLGFYFSHHISERFGNKKTIIVSVIVLALLIISATLAKGYMVLVLFELSSFLFGLRSPILGHLWNEEVESRKRATTNSINSFIYQLGVAVFVPLVGYWSDLFSAGTAFLLSALIILFISPIFFSFLKNN
ncbi:MAG: hypothetical protein A2261_03580 [Candidatus Magasanikbacteria bacterium RIFOXYA2_FULL_44_8]|uniref:Major facilitator superfamily (MFS) profile domain-containing protein n=1 Tax=Candidatus Magasanikbacteria bacterium RIFOXYA2_FULL_44_8 TaxID=1798696 RepID=A0A1F6NJZ1_9BACT|nr:MAG: hypothetical protein A2261_03580 [Candidatus Magasanikbacteria bacterium RIFOXYA2_FULL_44_8]